MSSKHEFTTDFPLNTEISEGVVLFSKNQTTFNGKPDDPLSAAGTRSAPRRVALIFPRTGAFSALLFFGTACAIMSSSEGTVVA